MTREQPGGPRPERGDPGGRRPDADRRQGLRTRRLGLAGLALLGLWSLAAPEGLAAQTRPGPGRVQLEERVRERFAQIVRRELELTEPQTGQLASALQDFQRERRALFRRRMEVQRRFRPAPDGADGFRAPRLEEEEARTLLQELADLHEEEARLFRSEQARLLEFLSPVQVARFYALREQLGERIRRLRGEGRRPGGAPGP